MDKLIKRQSCHDIETNQLICRANQLAGFYIMVTLAFSKLIFKISLFSKILQAR